MGQVALPRNESLSASEAADELGISARTLRRLCSTGHLPCFRTPGGQIRIRRADVDAYRQGSAPRIGPSATASSILATKREGLEALNLEVQERRVKRELQKLEEEDAEAERRRTAAVQADELVHRADLEKTRLQREHEVDQHARERQRTQWANGWLDWALKSVPQDAPQEVALYVQQAVEEVLSTLTPAHPQSVVQRLVLAAMERGLRPWRRWQETERAVQEARKQLPIKIQTFSNLLFPPNEWEVRAISAAREEIGFLSGDVSYEEKRAAAVRAGKQVATEYEAEQAGARAEQQRQRHESMKSFLISFGVGKVGSYLSGLHFEGEIWDDDLARKAELENVVRKGLDERLTGEETLEDVQQLAREIVDAEL